MQSNEFKRVIFTKNYKIKIVVPRTSGLTDFGDGSLTSSVKELMVDVVIRLTLDDLCLVMQAASRCPF